MKGGPRGRPRRYTKLKELKEIEDQPRVVMIPRGSIVITGRWPLVDPRREAIKMIAEYKIECKTAGKPYSREKAIKKAAKDLRMDWRSLANWINRSKRVRDS